MCSTLFTHTPTLNTDGTLIWQEYLPAGSGPQAPGGILDPTSEQVVLVSNSTYLSRLTNIGSQTIKLQFNFAFYEVSV